MYDVHIQIIMWFLLLGSVTGLLSGMLGIGGGVIVVPGLYFLFRHFHSVPHHFMHTAAGTSLAIMMATTGMSLRSHCRYDVPIWPVYQKLVIGMVLGVVLGALLATRLDSEALRIILGVIILLMAMKMLFLPNHVVKDSLPGRVSTNAGGFLVGTKSGLLGLGGGVITVPFLTFFAVPMRVAVAVSAAVSFTNACLGTLLYTLTGFFSSSSLDGAFSFIYWPAVFGVAIGSVTGAFFGVKLSHRCRVGLLKRLFAVLLLFIGIQLLV